ncbi:hypothetical protein D9758_007795 [Tetrapyrgos nigripes]|uniref:Uncharacterized protein n=1 Tax=Tetrapyrgos nigripes TaxID=182062 RepID=A0A8H5FVH4_9AGAR|nr:hypothetical protein D9758_007795 [Tetrapyrgos nigripes]
MGLFKRILSLGSKKSKKKRLEIHHTVPIDLPVDEIGVRSAGNDEDSEIAANLLLRSSSARYAVVAEMDYSSLPPLPHPIDNVLSIPSASTPDIPGTLVTRKGTYSVKVHQRQRHSTTDISGNSHLDPQITPRPRKCEQDDSEDAASRIMTLRRDPSVASLLDMYDEHGHLPSKAFSNSPTKEGRAQVKRSGSTLRQLLGETDEGPHSRDNSTSEGDISWAERYLAEAGSVASSVSSLVLQTPDNFDTHFPDARSLSHDIHDSTISSNYDLSSSLIENPAISSMEVELSICSEESPETVDRSYVSEAPYVSIEPKTPARRASQVFGFLTERRRSRAPEECYDRPLPELPSAFSSPSDVGSTEGPLRSHFSSDHSSESIYENSPAIPIPLIQDTPQHYRSSAVSSMRPSIDAFVLDTPAPAPRAGPNDSCILSPTGLENTSDTLPSDLEPEDVQKARKVRVIMTAPTKVIVTSATPSTADIDNRPPTRLPKGPRSLRQQQQHHRRRRTSSHSKRPTLLDRSNSASSSATKDSFTPISSRSRKPHRVSSSGSSWTFAEAEEQLGKLDEKPRKSRRGDLKSILEKENNLGLSVKSEIPSTPMRTQSSRSSKLLRAAVDHSFFQPPSPASSTELSPVGKQIMADARKHRSSKVRKDSHARR